MPDDIDDALAFFQARLKDTLVERCSCDDTDPEWRGDHLAMVEEGMKICFYPDPITAQVVVLGMKEVCTCDPGSYYAPELGYMDPNCPIHGDTNPKPMVGEP